MSIERERERSSRQPLIFLDRGVCVRGHPGGRRLCLGRKMEEGRLLTPSVPSSRGIPGQD